MQALEKFWLWERPHESVLVVLICGSVLAGLLLAFYRAGEGRSRGLVARALAAFDFPPEGAGENPWFRLAVASLLALFLELAVIRVVSSEIRIFAYLKNFVLTGCFLGFGIGCFLCRRRANLLALVLPLLGVTVVVAAPWNELRLTVIHLGGFIGPLAGVDTWGLPTIPRSWSAWDGLLNTLALTLPLFALIALAFVPIGQVVGACLERGCKGIRGYTVNILGSLGGILLFSMLAFFSQPPAIWYAVAGLMLVALMWRRPVLWLTAGAALFLVAWLSAQSGLGAFTYYWSPYQKLGIRPLQESSGIYAYELRTNDSWYQQILNLTPEFARAHPDWFLKHPLEWNGYNLPYHFYPQPPTVLVLGAGTGNDVAAALRNGAGAVEAVEIDPLILKLGRELHFEHPYSSPKVHVTLDDARAFLQNSSRQFDLILFSLLDSQTTNAYYSNIRIDNYVYTMEGMRAARRILKPDGLVIVKYSVQTPWIGGRLEALLEAVFGEVPVQMEASGGPYSTPGNYFICGSRERIAAAMKDPGLADYAAHNPPRKMTSAQMTTDDWPYFYQREPGLPTIVVLISILLVPLCWLLLRATGAAGESLEWHFFFLGAGFLLMETQIISKMALLFGTTWLVNAVAIAGLLLLIVAANVVAEWRPDFPLAWAYAGIFLTLLGAYLTPVRALLFPSLGWRIGAATLVLCLPVFFAGIVFVRSFAAVGFRGEALGSNLFGALAGALLEATSFWFGLRFLLLLAGALYLASWLTLSARREVVRVGAQQAPTPAA